MGRRARYISVSEQKAAARTRRALYAQSSTAKARRCVYDQRVYKRLHSRRGGKSVSCSGQEPPSLALSGSPSPYSELSPPPSYPVHSLEPVTLSCSAASAIQLPANILYLALLPLPENTHLFKEALKSADALDESELPQWDQDPPYVVTGPQDTPSEIRWTGRLEEVMHGRRMRQQREADERRRRYHWQGRKTSLRNELERVMHEAWVDYERIESVMRTYQGGGREMAMGVHLLRWKARSIYHAKLQLESLTDDLTQYEI